MDVTRWYRKERLFHKEWGASSFFHRKKRAFFPQQMWQGAWCAVCLLLLLAFGPLQDSVQAAEMTTPPITTPPQKQVLLLLINRLDFDDIAQMPHLQQWEAAGAIGLMNVNTGGEHTIGNSYATMALGTPTVLAPADLQVVSGGENWQRVVPHVAVTAFGQGKAWKASHGVYVLSMPRLERSLSRNGFAAKVGESGDLLRKQGLQAAVFGTSDYGGVSLRPAALFTADSQGVTPWGRVGSDMLASAPERPFGVRTDYRAMWAAYQQWQGRLSLAVFDLADLYRFSVYHGRLDPVRADAMHRETLQELDRFVGLVLQQRKPNQLLLLAVPQVADDAPQKQWLAPVLAVGGDFPADAVLTSATTRRSGIVSNLDVMPTVMHFLGSSVPKEMIGYPLVGSHGVAQESLGGLLQATVWKYTDRGLVFGMMGVLAGGGLMAAILRIFWGVGLSFRRVRDLLIAMLAMPLCLYVLPLFRVHNLWETAGGVLALYMLFVAIPFRILPLGRTLNGRFWWLGAWTVGVVLVDTWQGGRLAQNSLLSYDVVDGARYYGVGNEYMGVVVGAAVLLYGAMRQTERYSSKRLGFCGVLGGLLLTAFFASPKLGTNTGGALTMAATVGFCLAQQKRLRWFKTSLVVLVSLLAAASILYVQNLDSSPPSHIGMAAHQVLSGGLQEWARIWNRKSNLFWHLFTVTIWPSVVMVLMAGFAYFLLGPFDRNERWMGRHAGLRVSFGGLWFGSWVGLFTNDSGVVVAAMMFLFALWPALLIALETEQETMQRLQQVEAA